MTLDSYKSASLIQPGISSTTLPESVREWNATRTDYPREKTVAQLFEEIAAIHADAVAVTFERKSAYLCRVEQARQSPGPRARAAWAYAKKRWLAAALSAP